MPRYLINELSFIDNRLVQAGSEITTDTPPGSHWEPLDKEAKAARANFDKWLEGRMALAKAEAEKAAKLPPPTDDLVPTQ